MDCRSSLRALYASKLCSLHNIEIMRRTALVAGAAISSAYFCKKLTISGPNASPGLLSNTSNLKHSHCKVDQKLLSNVTFPSLLHASCNSVTAGASNTPSKLDLTEKSDEQGKMEKPRVGFKVIILLLNNFQPFSDLKSVHSECESSVHAMLC